MYVSPDGMTFSRFSAGVLLSATCFSAFLCRDRGFCLHEMHTPTKRCVAFPVSENQAHSPTPTPTPTSAPTPTPKPTFTPTPTPVLTDIHTPTDEDPVLQRKSTPTG